MIDEFNIMGGGIKEELKKMKTNEREGGRP
jgi:hypothetical protein